MKIVLEKYQATRITTATTTNVQVGPATLGGIYVEVALAGTVTIQENGSTIGILPIGTTEGFKRFPAVISKDLDIITSSALDEIVVFSLKG